MGKVLKRISDAPSVHKWLILMSLPLHVFCSVLEFLDARTLFYLDLASKNTLIHLTILDFISRMGIVTSRMLDFRGGFPKPFLEWVSDRNLKLDYLRLSTYSCNSATDFETGSLSKLRLDCVLLMDISRGLVKRGYSYFQIQFKIFNPESPLRRRLTHPYAAISIGFEFPCFVNGRDGSDGDTDIIKLNCYVNERLRMIYPM